MSKGQLVCELDSAALKDQLTNQVIATRGADAAYQNARLTREVAEIAVTEYVEGVFKQDLETAKGEIALAESDLARAEDRVEWSNRMFEKGYVSKAQKIADALALQRAKFALEQAQSKRSVLEEYTKKKTTKELESEVEKTRADELAKEQTWSLEKSKQAKLEKQIVNCKLYAPGDGLVVYANDPNRFGGSSQPQIEEGATVRERQKIFSLPDISKMRVNTKVHESMIDRLSPGLRARIRVDAFADQVLTGVVESVAPLPDPSSFFSSDVKVYTTLVSIENGLPGLRPGMTARGRDPDHGAAGRPERPGPGGPRIPGQGPRRCPSRRPSRLEGRHAGDLQRQARPGPRGAQDRRRRRAQPGHADVRGREALGVQLVVGQGRLEEELGRRLPRRTACPAPALPAGPDATKGGSDSKAKAKGKGKGQRSGSRLNPAMIEKLKAASPHEQRQMLLDQGVPSERVDTILQRINSGESFGGDPPGGGPPGSGFGGPGGPKP